MKTLGFSDDFDLYISVALTGSFSETGRVFEMPASSVMRRINNLEEKLETRLINRSTKKLVLTETGALFLK
ncbi:TPA: LysR family transcriptional regulator, partial [Pseudomonas aeruginosa]